MRTVGGVTIGQSPRTDVVGDMSRFLPGVSWIQAGALDDLDPAGIAALAPAGGDFPLVTRLRDGGSVVVGEQVITPLMQRAVERVERAADVVLVLCSGRIEVTSSRPIVFPGLVLGAIARALFAGQRVLVLTPHDAQVEPQRSHWQRQGLDAIVRFASPYAATDFTALGREARGLGVSAAVLDCIGYSLDMQTDFTAASGLPSIAARSVAARVVAELLGIPGSPAG